MSDKMFLDWDMVQRDAEILAEEILKKVPQEQIKGLVAVTRGGMMSAQILAYILGIRIIETVALASYEDRKQQALKLVKDLHLSDGGQDWLIVDDLTDTGKSFEFLKKKFPNALSAAIYAKPLGKADVDFYARGVEQETWLVFPWEISTSGAEYDHA